MSSNNTSTPSTMSSPAPAKKVAKKSTPAASETPAAAAPVAPVAAPSPAASAAPKKTVKKTAAAAPTEAPVAAPAPVVAAPAEAAPAEATPEVSFESELAAVQQELTRIRDAASSALAALKRVAKRHSADVKEARKNRRVKSKVAEDGAPARPNNFKIPVPISDELAAFFGSGKNTLMSRTEVNSRIHEYIKSHSLGQGQNINADAALRKLFKLSADAKLDIFNLQTHLKAHYPKVAKPAA